MDMLENEIGEATYKASIDPEIHLTYAKKKYYDNECNTYRDKTSRLQQQQGQAF